MRLLLMLCCLLFCMPGLAQARPVNINTASVDEIAASLRGIGPKRADRIVNYRKRHGPFKTPEDVMAVPYIGRRLYESNRPDIRVE